MVVGVYTKTNKEYEATCIILLTVAAFCGEKRPAIHYL